mmetsp:Transcript_18271/g.59604  ORF Transcript_18271/g.59604 Transcript_18271/m.59604 type:complete len:514 (-) Transcript_18271:337-1878(-)
MEPASRLLTTDTPSRGAVARTEPAKTQARRQRRRTRARCALSSKRECKLLGGGGGGGGGGRRGKARLSACGVDSAERGAATPRHGWVTPRGGHDPCRLGCVEKGTRRARAQRRRTARSRIRVERRVDLRRDGLDLGGEVLFNLVEVEAVVEGDEVDGQAEVAEAAGPADAVQVGLCLLGEVEVDDDVDGGDVDPAREEVRRDQVSAGAVAEVVEDAVPVLLDHLSVDVVAREAELGDLLGEELDARGRVAEDDGLVDRELGEERVEAVHLLLLLDERVVLRHAVQRQLVHQVDLVRLVHDAVAEGGDLDGEGRGEEQDLPPGRHPPDQLLDERHELWREELVRLVEGNGAAARQVGHVLLGHVEDAAGRGDHEVHRLHEPEDVLLQRRAARRDHDLEVEVLAEVAADLRRLERELARRDEDDGLDVVLGGVGLLEDGNHKGGRLARPVFRAREHVPPREGDGYALLLDRRGPLKPRLENAHEELALEEVILKVVSLGGGHVGRLDPLVLGRQH